MGKVILEGEGRLGKRWRSGKDRKEKKKEEEEEGGREGGRGLL